MVTGFLLNAAGDVMSYVMEYLQPIFMILMALSGIATIVLVLMQKGSNDNIGVIGGNEMDTYAGRNKTRSKDFKLRIGTIVCGILMLLFSIGYFVLFIIWNSIAG